MEENPATASAKPVRKRRWFQYSLRTLLILMAVVAIPLAWWSYKAERQRKAVETLRKNDAWIFYSDDSTAQPDPKSQFLHWRYRVRGVWLRRQPSDNDIMALQTLDGLKYVVVYHEASLAPVRAVLPNCKVGLMPTTFAEITAPVAQGTGPP